MTKAVWYFDFISPFAYFQQAHFRALPQDLEIAYRPILFAGLLDHWEHKGPAEIPRKRQHTYRYCVWYAARHSIPFKMPPAHPFNPLKALRLSVALGDTPEVVSAIFAAIWAEGGDLTDPKTWAALTEHLGVADADDQITGPEVKAALRRNTEEAAAAGVFGVPTFAVDDELFWGVDSTEMFLDYLKDPGRFDEGELGRAVRLPVGIQRSVV